MIFGRSLNKRGWPLCAFLALATYGHAAEVSGVRVTHHGASFLIDMQIAIDAPAPAVFRALQDYAAMARFNPDLRAVRVEPTRAPHRMRLFTTIHTCVLIFCKTMHQEQIMTATASSDGGTLDAELLPTGGDFKRGRGVWIVKPCPAARGLTCMDIRIELVPAFWVPPAIGPWVMRRKMSEEAHRTGDGLERTAQNLAQRSASWGRATLLAGRRLSVSAEPVPVVALLLLHLLEFLQLIRSQYRAHPRDQVALQILHLLPSILA